MNAPRRTVMTGEHLAPRVIGPITQTDIVRFAGAGGDFNPLHHDPAFAKMAGFEAPISMGQMQAAMVAGFVSDAFGVENLRTLSVRFRAPLMIGQTLTIDGTVTAIDPDGTATLQLRATTSQGEVVTGEATVLVADA